MKEATMALFDKVKSSAQDVAKRAQEAGRIGQAKLDDFQAKRQLDALYRDLGEATYAKTTGAPDASNAAVEAAVAAITSHLAATDDDESGSEAID
jgi:hypothetical protein